LGDGFYKACVDYYKEGSKKHDSPTSRLVSQKNTTVQHKQELLDTFDRSRSYNQFYSSPGRSYVVEPERNKEIDYNMASKDLEKFYDNVLSEKVVRTKYENYSPRRIKIT